MRITLSIIAQIRHIIKYKYTLVVLVNIYSRYQQYNTLYLFNAVIIILLRRIAGVIGEYTQIKVFFYTCIQYKCTFV